MFSYFIPFAISVQTAGPYPYNLCIIYAQLYSIHTLLVIYQTGTIIHLLIECEVIEKECSKELLLRKFQF